jgi:hypothetical protein
MLQLSLSSFVVSKKSDIPPMFWVDSSNWSDDPQMPEIPLSGKINQLMDEFIGPFGLRCHMPAILQEENQRDCS